MSYLNTKPLVYGFEKGMMQGEITISYDYPSKLEEQLKNKEIDIALLPVAAIPGIENAKVITQVCIGASKPVASVCLFSEVPLQEITHIYLDYQSRTSVELLKILLKEFYKITPVLLPATPGYIVAISGTTAGLVIGDRAFALRKKFAHIYDLAEAWQQDTGLPFLFAAWVSNIELPEIFLHNFEEATSFGLSHLPAIAAEKAIPDYNLMKYYTENIDYELNAGKKEGMRLFLEKIK